MIDIERLRRVAVKRERQGLVGMILTVDQVLELIARGDAQQLAYQVRIEDLEAEVARLRARELPPEDAETEYSNDLVPIGTASEQTGVAASTIANMVRRGAIYGELRPAPRSDGHTLRMTHVDPEEIQMYAELPRGEKIMRRKRQRDAVSKGG